MRLMMRAATAVMCIFLAGAAVKAPPKQQPEPRAYVLMEAQTCTVLDSLNADERLNCGYLSKLMSLLLIAEDIAAGKYTLDTQLTASQSVSGTKGSVVWLEPGDAMSVEELLKSVIIGNANDALTVIAEASERSVEGFVMRMNAEAFDLGLRDTAFYSPYGYPDAREYTTARDLAVICAKLSQYNFLRPYFCTWRDFVKEGQVELVSENTLSRTYDRHIGFKAAHSDLSGYCTAESGTDSTGTVYNAVVLGAEDADISLSKAKTLVNSGFSGYKVTPAVFPEEAMRPLEVRGGEASAVELTVGEQSAIVLPRGTGELRTVAVIPQYIEAPVTAGQRLGTAAFYNGKTLVCETDITAKTSVPRLTYWYTFCKLMSKLIE
ncbi:MAG: D-alanyl-D-alanine carboxypeptidase [Ruminococcus sp.]|nr:D-alanyl-D-alanine carboxypeptidase [Ruminococcus sp.]